MKHENGPGAAGELFMHVYVFPLGLITYMISASKWRSILSLQPTKPLSKQSRAAPCSLIVTEQHVFYLGPA